MSHQATVINPNSVFHGLTLTVMKYDGNKDLVYCSMEGNLIPFHMNSLRVNKIPLCRVKIVNLATHTLLNNRYGVALKYHGDQVEVLVDLHHILVKPKNLEFTQPSVTSMTGMVYGLKKNCQFNGKTVNIIRDIGDRYVCQLPNQVELHVRKDNVMLLTNVDGFNVD
jgi:hypothetical protein